MTPTPPKLSAVEKLVATLDKHPLGTLATVVLAALFVVAMYVAKH
jgi:hypothetical protein